MIIVTKVEITPRFIGVLLLIIVGVTITGMYMWLQVGPENNVRMWLDKTEVERDGSLKLSIWNLGSKSIGYGSSYLVVRLNENGTETEMNPDWAWAASLGVIRPFTTRTQN